MSLLMADWLIKIRWDEAAKFQAAMVLLWGKRFKQAFADWTLHDKPIVHSCCMVSDLVVTKLWAIGPERVILLPLSVLRFCQAQRTFYTVLAVWARYVVCSWDVTRHYTTMFDQLLQDKCWCEKVLRGHVLEKPILSFTLKTIWNAPICPRAHWTAFSSGT
jgi:hypothetical protein